MVSVIAKKLRDIRINQGELKQSSLGHNWKTRQKPITHKLIWFPIGIPGKHEEQPKSRQKKKPIIFLLDKSSSCSALMDLCDEADTANDGKISIAEYLTITKNYGIKVVPLQN